MVKLPVKLFKIKNRLFPLIAKEPFNQATNNYNLGQSLLAITRTHSGISHKVYTMPEAIFHCISIISFLRPKSRVLSLLSLKNQLVYSEKKLKMAT